jgi:hypothetical protein
MKRDAIPGVLDMTRLKYGPEATPEQKDRVADALRRAGRRSEALLLYEGRADHPAVAEDLAWAIREGAAFTLFQVRRLGFPVTDEQRRACAAAAEAKERWFDAHRLYEVLGDAAALERVRQRIPGYVVAVPENKK